MLELQIDNLSFGGRGIGRHDGKAVFVPGVIPGESVRCRVVNDHKRHAEAELLEVVSPSPDRIASLCPVADECGGCQWQHLPYAAQLKWKETLFRDALSRALPAEPSLFQPIVSSRDEWNYRCRAQVKCRKTEQGFVTGFYRSGSHYVVDIEQCPLLAPQINRALRHLKPQLAGFERAHRVPQLDFTVDDQGHLSLIIHYLDDDLEPLQDLLHHLPELSGCQVHVQTGRKDTLTELLPGAGQAICPLPDSGLNLRFPPGGFIQVNLEQNRQMVNHVVEMVPPGRNVLDLYCGIGNFSIPLAMRATHVTGVEDYAPAILSARENAAAAGLRNVDFFAEPAETRIASFAGGQFDVVLLDPPRTGAYETVKLMPQLKPESILYVSCDPMTLVRDLKFLVHNGYRLVSSRPFDMFPQTWHVESVTLLERVV